MPPWRTKTSELTGRVNGGRRVDQRRVDGWSLNDGVRFAVSPFRTTPPAVTEARTVAFARATLEVVEGTLAAAHSDLFRVVHASGRETFGFLKWPVEDPSDGVRGPLLIEMPVDILFAESPCG